jgi:hypothetical protein
MSYKPNVGRMSLRRLLVVLYHAKQTCLAGIVVPALVVVVIRRASITIPLSNTENAQRSAADASLPATTLARNFVMNASTVDSVYHVVR